MELLPYRLELITYMKAQGMRCHLFLPTIPWKKMYTQLLEVHCPCNHLQQGLWLKTFQMYTKPSWKSILRTVRVPSSCVGPTMWIFAGDRGVGFIQQRRLDLHLAKVCSSPLPVLCYNPVPVLHILWPSSSSSSPLFFSLISFQFVFVLGYPIFNNL